ncbi:guanine nucleotide-binding protein-like 3 isoform X1 [Lampetra planeri]
MKRPKLKKASKRMTCSKRFKIQKKVREHKRKQRKEAKKKGTGAGSAARRARKDPGVPNLAPFKDAVLRDAELKKQQAEELKVKRKEARQKELQKKRDERSKRTERKTDRLSTKDPVAMKTKPEALNKRLLNELHKVLGLADVVLLVLDARDPLGCRCPQLEQTVLEAGKPLVFLLNKIDLVPKDSAEKWLGFLGREHPTVLFKCSTQLPGIGVKAQLPGSEVLVSRSVGEEALMGLLLGLAQHHHSPISSGGSGSKRSKHATTIDTATTDTTAAGEDTEDAAAAEIAAAAEDPAAATTPAVAATASRVAVVGFPNVGKSSIINSLRKTRLCNVGPNAAVTRAMQEVCLNNHSVRMLDSPPVLPSADNAEVALVLRGLHASGVNLADAVRKLDAILERCNMQQIMLHYMVPDFCNTSEFLELLARRRGHLKKGGVPDHAAAARAALSGWLCGKLSFHTSVPADLAATETTKKLESPPLHYDRAALDTANADTLSRCRFPMPAGSIAVKGYGSTKGVLNDLELQQLQQLQQQQQKQQQQQQQAVTASASKGQQQRNGNKVEKAEDNKDEKIEDMAIDEEDDDDEDDDDEEDDDDDDDDEDDDEDDDDEDDDMEEVTAEGNGKAAIAPGPGVDRDNGAVTRTPLGRTRAATAAAAATPAAATKTATPAPTKTATPAPTKTAAPAATKTAAPAAATKTATPAVTKTALPAATKTATPAATKTAPPAAARAPNDDSYDFATDFYL